MLYFYFPFFTKNVGCSSPVSGGYPNIYYRTKDFRFLSAGILLRLCTLFRFRQMPSVFCREQPQNNDHGKAGRHGQIGVVFMHDGADTRPDNTGTGIKVLDEDHGYIPGTYIAQHSAAYSGDHAEKNFQKNIIKRYPGGNTDHRKRTQTDGVRQNPDQPVKIYPPADKRQKDNDRRNDGYERIDRIAKSGRRHDADNNIPDNSAADSGNESHCRDPEDVHFLLYSDDRARNGESNGTYYFKNTFKHFTLLR